MKVIFLKDVPKLGKKDDVKEMNEGYVRNFLLPQRLVEIATTSSLSKLRDRKVARDTAEAFESAKNETILKSLSNCVISIASSANEKGVLFKAINAKDIAPLLTEKTGLPISESLFKDVHIKNLGEHDLPFTISGKTGVCKVIITQK